MKTYKNDARQAIYEIASGLHRAGIIDNPKLRGFEDSCLVAVSLMPDEVKSLREREDITQEGLALFLGVDPTLVGEWERGERTPGYAEFKLLDLVRRKGIDAIR